VSIIKVWRKKFNWCAYRKERNS